MTDSVHVDFRKYPDAKHWQYPMRRLASDEFGLWLWAPAGTPTKRGDEPVQHAESTFIKLLADDAWHSAIWNQAGSFEIYVDINTPPRWEGNRVRMVDLDLDVVRFRESGQIAILDEDEFEEHKRAHGYPPQLVDGARTAAAQVFVALSSATEPFGETGALRLAQAIELARRTAT